MNPSEPYDRYDTIIDESTNSANTTLVQQLGEKSGVYRREGTSKDGSTTLISYFFKLPTPTIPLKVNNARLDNALYLPYSPNNTDLTGYKFEKGATSLAYRNKQKAQDVTNDTKIYPYATGCGDKFSAVTRSNTMKLDDLEKVGVTDTGRAVYRPKDYQNNALVKKVYEKYKEYDSQITLDEYMYNHAFMVIENADKELLLYLRGYLGAFSQC